MISTSENGKLYQFDKNEQSTRPPLLFIGKVKSALKWEQFLCELQIIVWIFSIRDKYEMWNKDNSAAEAGKSQHWMVYISHIYPTVNR